MAEVRARMGGACCVDPSRKDIAPPGDFFPAKVAEGILGNSKLRLPGVGCQPAKTDAATRNWSGKRDSNPRPSAWKADALPTELLPPLDRAQTPPRRSNFMHNKDLG